MDAKHEKILKIVALIVIPIAIAVPSYLIYKAYKKRKDEGNALEEEVTASATNTIKTEGGTIVPVVGDNFPLHLGSKGPNVKKLQDLLVKKGWNYNFKTQAGYGIFGKQTLANVQKYFKKDTIDPSDLIEQVDPPKAGLLKAGQQVWATTMANIRDFPNSEGASAGKILGIVRSKTTDPVGRIEKFSSDGKGWVYGTFGYMSKETGRPTTGKGWVNGFSLTNIAP